MKKGPKYLSGSGSGSSHVKVVPVAQGHGAFRRQFNPLQWLRQQRVAGEPFVLGWKSSLSQLAKILEIPSLGPQDNEPNARTIQTHDPERPTFTINYGGFNSRDFLYLQKITNRGYTGGGDFGGHNGGQGGGGNGSTESGTQGGSNATQVAEQSQSTEYTD